MDTLKLSDWTIIRRYAVPQMIGLLFNSVYFIIDGIFIGRILGEDALASAGVAIPIVEIMIALSMMISIGSGIMISRFSAQNKVQEARDVFNKANLFTLILTIMIVILGNVFVSELSRLLGASDVLIVDTVIYLRYFLSASPFLVFSFTFSTFARNDHEPKLAMWSLIFGAISNIFLDYIFMVPFNMGMAGAALATALGPVVSVIILLPHFLGKRGNLYFQKVKLKISDVIDICTKGAAAFITNFSIGFVTLCYNIAIVSYNLGENKLSAFTIIGYLFLIALTIFLGSSQGIQPALSVFSTRDMKDRVKSLTRRIVLFNLALAIILYFIIYFKGTRIISLFTQDSDLVITTGIIAKTYLTSVIIGSVNIVYSTVLQALNYQKESVLISITRSGIPLIIMLLVLPQFMGESGIWFAMSAVEIVTLCVTLILLNQTIYKKERREVLRNH